MYRNVGPHDRSTFGPYAVRQALTLQTVPVGTEQKKSDDLVAKIFRVRDTTSDGLTGIAANRLEPGSYSQGGESVVILSKHNHDIVDRICSRWIP